MIKETTNTNSITYEQLISTVEGISIVKSTDKFGDGISPSKAKRMFCAVISLLEFYRNNKPNAVIEKNILSRVMD